MLNLLRREGLSCIAFFIAAPPNKNEHLDGAAEYVKRRSRKKLLLSLR